MSTSLTDKISIYVTVDLQTVSSYFNKHDPSPLYKKELNHHFEEYILHAVGSAKRYSAIFYKLNCPGAVNRQYAEPLMYAIHRHFSLKKAIRNEKFCKFKRRSFLLLAFSCATVILCETLLPLVISQHAEGFFEGLKNCLDVFSWVLLWRPIYDLLFEWNIHLKEILLLSKLATAEVIIVDNNKNTEAVAPVKYNSRNGADLNGSSLSLESLLVNRIDDFS